MKDLYVCFAMIFGMSTSLSGCQSYSKKITSDRLMISEGRENVFPNALTNNQVQEDLAYLAYAFENIYIGNFYDNRERTQELLRKIKETQFSQDAVKFHDQVDNLLFELMDEHTLAVRKGKVGSLREVYEKQSQINRSLKCAE